MGWGKVRFEIGQVARFGAIVALSLTLAHCGKVSNKYGVPASARVVEPGAPVPKGGGTYRVGRPYTIAGRTYTPEDNKAYNAEGLASWYGEDFHGRQTANGEVFDMHAISAAHPTLPMPSYVRVTNLNNGRSLIVRVNDRGPYHPGRVIDVSVRAAKMLGFHHLGTTRVRVEYVGRAALEGSDDTKLAATLRRDGTPAPAATPVMVASRSPAPVNALSTAFRNEIFDPKPLTRGPAAAGTASQPPVARPVRTTSEIAAHRPSPLAAAPRPVYGVASAQAAPAPRPLAGERPASFDSRFGPALATSNGPVRTAPLSAYAPPQPASTGVLTGRGLY
jgi:rare lipoprotein A